MRDPVGRAVGPAELGKGVQLDSRAEDLAVEGQGSAGGAGEVDIWRRVRPGEMLAAGRAPLGRRRAPDGSLQQ